MSNLKTQIRVTIALGVLSLLAGLITHLALTDIYHGEADVRAIALQRSPGHKFTSSSLNG
jgi:hypothetical protein